MAADAPQGQVQGLTEVQRPGAHQRPLLSWRLTAGQLSLSQCCLLGGTSGRPRGPRADPARNFVHQNKLMAVRPQLCCLALGIFHPPFPALSFPWSGRNQA